MFRRSAPGHIRLIDSRWGTRFFSAAYPVLSRTRFWEFLDTDYAEYKLHKETAPQISFTEEEEAKGKALLAEMGITNKDWFVCFHARDGAYLRKWRPELSEFWDKNDWRNNPVKDYFDALDFITEQGGYALRMGAIVEEPLDPERNPRVIDYATQYRSDFLDIFLISKCRFFIGTNSGLAWVPPVFGVPVVMIDYTPYSHSRLYNDIMVPRLLVTQDNGRPVSFAEAMEKEFYSRSRDTSKKGNKNPHLFAYGQSDSEDILMACKDMFDMLEKRQPEPEARELQNLYAETYLNHLPDYDLAAKVSARWAVKHRDLIVPEAPVEKNSQKQPSPACPSAS